MSANVPVLGIRQRPQSPAHVVTHPQAGTMATWGIVACVAAFVLCELALVLA